MDTFGRPLRNLRLSVTDRCILRCAYCMPEENYAWLPKGDVLSYEEVSRLVDAFVLLGVEKVRVTGGEPLLRRDVSVLIESLSAKPGLKDIALTTNATRLREQAETLKRAGLDRLTISLDTLRPDRFLALTRRDDFARTIDGIDAGREAGFERTKLNAVIMRGVNDDELVELVSFGKERDIEVRFIEYMDVGGATNWNMEDVVSRAEMLERLTEHFGPIEEVGRETEVDLSAPAQRFRLSDGTVFGIVASTTSPFCAACDRSRLTADGVFFTCLYAREGLDLRTPLRKGADGPALAEIVRERWGRRDDRGAEERLAQTGRESLAEATELRGDPHLEMHTRGG